MSYVTNIFLPTILSLTLLSGTQALGKPLTLVRATTVTREDYAAAITLTGEVVARHSLNLSFRIGGQISEILVDAGDHVEAGTVLARLDPQLQKADLAAAEASVEAAKSQLLLAQSEFERNKDLLDQGFTTRAIFDRSEVALASATGDFEAISAQLELAQNALGFTQIIAPEAGTVTQKFTEEGQITQVAQPVFTFARNGARDAVFDVYEAVFFQQNVNFTVELSLVENPEAKSSCILREVSPVINPYTGTVHVKCGIMNPPSSFTLASVVSGTALLPEKSLFVLPWEAMTSYDGNPAVWVYDKNTGTVSIRTIDVEQYETGKILVRTGISEGEIVITEGAKFLREEMAVTILEGAAK